MTSTKQKDDVTMQMKHAARKRAYSNCASESSKNKEDIWARVISVCDGRIILLMYSDM